MRNTRILPSLAPLGGGRGAVAYFCSVSLTRSPTPSGAHGLLETPGQDRHDRRSGTGQCHWLRDVFILESRLAGLVKGAGHSAQSLGLVVVGKLMVQGPEVPTLIRPSAVSIFRCRASPSRQRTYRQHNGLAERLIEPGDINFERTSRLQSQPKFTPSHVFDEQDPRPPSETG